MAAVIIFCCLLLGFFPGLPADTAGQPVHELQPAVYWSGDGVEVFLVRGMDSQMELTVLASFPVRVVARTERNSTVPVHLRMTPLESAFPGVSRYRFRHRFSRTTIWLALDFYRDGRRLDGLTRCFYEGIDFSANRTGGDECPPEEN